ncbi:MAG: YbaB/EbfC family nucleoid-associated protein [Patescibacteria group bacterium]
MLNGIKNTLGNVGKIAQAKQQQDKLEKLMASVSATGYSKNKKVAVTINGKQNIVNIIIDPSLINFVYENTTSKGLEDSTISKSIMEACEDAQKKLQPEMMKKLQESGNLNDLMGMLSGM